MNLAKISDHPLTMNSAELAELIGIERKEANRKIRDMFRDEIEGGIISLTHRANGQVEYYMLPEIESTMFVGKWHTPFLRVLSEYWVNRKNQKPVIQLPDFTNPAEAARAWADEVEKKQLAEQQLALAAPKVEFVDKFVETGTTKTFRETAKILGYPERKMISLLIEQKVLYRQSGGLLPYQKYHAKKLFEVKTGEANGHAYTQTRVTAKGVQWIAERYTSDLG